MGGLGRQGKRKGESRSVAMSKSMEELHVADRWERPPADECEEQGPITTSLPEADPNSERLKIRMMYGLPLYELVEFSITYQTYWRGRWRDVIEIDTCHHGVVHLHRYARRTAHRIPGDPESLSPLACVDDVQKGYDLAHSQIEQTWASHKQRWQHA